MKRRKNCGSAVIELTMLMPVLLGCIYLYIMLFLFFVKSGKGMEELADCIYRIQTNSDRESEESGNGILVRTQGKVKTAKMEQQGNLFTIRIELRKDENNPVENLRRWQLVTDKF